MKNLIRLFLVLLAFPLYAIEGLYLGLQAGQVQLAGSAKELNDNAIGFGLDLGIKTQSYLDVMFQSQISSHTGYTTASKTTPGTNLKIYSQTLGANFHFGNPDFDFSLGGGPGLYFVNSVNSNSYFGLHIAGGADVLVSDEIRLGLQARYHFLFQPQKRDDYWSIMARAGYQFNLG
ncbi:MAG: outer membrane beta-barrel protein [Pseudomonadota bacterium]